VHVPQGKVLYQNASSLAYMGDLLSVKYDNRLSDGLLRVLFMYDLHNLEQMLEDVLGGQEWQGVVQVGENYGWNWKHCMQEWQGVVQVGEMYGWFCG
jgi:hypothetical protein